MVRSTTCLECNGGFRHTFPSSERITYLCCKLRAGVCKHLLAVNHGGKNSPKPIPEVSAQFENVTANIHTAVEAKLNAQNGALQLTRYSGTPGPQNSCGEEFDKTRLHPDFQIF